jgi:hypothetical protein
LHIEKTGLQPQASAFFKLPNLVCRRSEGPQSALHVEMCMAQHLSLRPFGKHHGNPLCLVQI